MESESKRKIVKVQHRKGKNLKALWAPFYRSKFVGPGKVSPAAQYCALLQSMHSHRAGTIQMRS